MPWSSINFSQLIIYGNVWRSVWRICMRILGLKGLKLLIILYALTVTKLWKIFQQWQQHIKLSNRPIACKFSPPLIPSATNGCLSKYGQDSLLFGSLVRRPWRKLCKNSNSDKTIITKLYQPNLISVNKTIWSSKQTKSHQRRQH